MAAIRDNHVLESMQAEWQTCQLAHPSSSLPSLHVHLQLTFEHFSMLSDDKKHETKQAWFA